MSAVDVQLTSGGPNAPRKFLPLLTDVPSKRVAVPDPSVFPWSAVARLDFLRDGQLISNASGFLAAPGVVLTAAHNLKQIYDRLDISLGYDATLNKGVKAVYRGKNAVHRLRDVAVLLVDPLPMRHFPIGSMATERVTLAGYPENSKRQTAGNGPCTQKGALHRYDVNVGQGDSGAPAFVWDGSNAQCIAVHVQRKLVPEAGKLLGIGEALDAVLVGELQDLIDDLMTE